MLRLSLYLKAQRHIKNVKSNNKEIRNKLNVLMESTPIQSQQDKHHFFHNTSGL